MMKYFGLYLLVLFIMLPRSVAQEFSVLAKGSFLPNFTMSSDVAEIRYSSLYSFGSGLRVQFMYPFRFMTGIEFQYGAKDRLSEIKPEPNPNAPEGIGDMLGASRDVRWIHLEVPILCRIVTNDHFIIDGGIKLGIGNFKQTDRIISYDAYTGSELNRQEKSSSQNAIIYSPVMELGFPIRNSFNVIAGIEYVFFNPSFENTTYIQSDIDPSGNNSVFHANPIIHSTGKWDLTGIQLSCSILYSF